MALITRTTYVAGTTILAAAVNSNENTIFNDYNGNISNVNIAMGAAIADTKLAQIVTASKVSGSAITLLTSVPSGAGLLPIANIATGTPSGAKFVRDDGTLQVPPGVQTSPFTLSYTSTAQTISIAGQLVLAHSMATVPALVQSRLVCTSAEGGYSVNDIVMIDSMIGAATNTATNNGTSVVIDATNITIRYGSDGTGPYVLINKTTGASFIITPAKWQLIVKAWA